MSYIETYCEDKIDFEKKVRSMITGWEVMIDKDPSRAKEYEDVIWGAHRILALLCVDIKEDNDVF